MRHDKKPYDYGNNNKYRQKPKIQKKSARISPPPPNLYANIGAIRKYTPTTNTKN